MINPENDMKPVRGAWQVVGGVIPGTPIPEHTKQWHYTAADYEDDLAMIRKTLSEEEPQPKTKFLGLRSQAEEYMRTLCHPAYLNWVEMTWIWF